MAFHDHTPTGTASDGSLVVKRTHRRLILFKPLPIGMLVGAAVLFLCFIWLSTRVPSVAPEDLLLLEPASVERVESAAAGGNLRAQAALGSAHLFGNAFIAKNVTRALSWLHKVADRDPKEFDRIESRTQSLFDQRRRETSARSQRELDLEYLDLVGTKLAYEQAFIGLASVYAGENGAVYRDSSLALKYLRRGAAYGFPSAQRFLGFAYVYGWFGVHENEFEGRRWLHVAAAGGDRVAIEWLKNLDQIKAAGRTDKAAGSLWLR